MPNQAFAFQAHFLDDLVGLDGGALVPGVEAAAVGADFFQFDITPDARLPAIVGESVRYVGQRYSVSTRLAGRPFVHPFGLDIGFGDPVVGEIGKRTGKDTLGFAGVPPPEVRVYPVETHVAEKLHAYTLPRARANSRVKDLPDIALLALDIREHDNPKVRQILATHGWFQTIPSDHPHFTYLGVTANHLPALGLKQVVSGGRSYWVPDF